MIPGTADGAAAARQPGHSRSGGDGRLGLFDTASKLTIKSDTGAAVTSLEHDGEVTIGGQHYFVYSLIGSAAGVGEATF